MRTKELIDCGLGFCSLKNLFIKSYQKCMGKQPSRRIILEKVAWQTELETVSELFCVEDSNSNYEQKQASYLKRSVSYAKDLILCCLCFIIFEPGF